MKAITLWQPYASLVAVGAKTIETRSWPAPASLIGERLLIHAAKVVPDPVLSESMRDLLTDDRDLAFDDLTLGAVVASCRLAACVPMVDGENYGTDDRPVLAVFGSTLTFIGDDKGDDCHLGTADAERPFGDFTPGRFAWLLEDVKPTTERCPRCWGDRYLDAWVNRTDYGTGTEYDGEVCPTCTNEDGEPLGVCAPVPMKGHQRVWTVREEDWPDAD